MANLSQKKCIPCEGGEPLSEKEIQNYLKVVPNWQFNDQKISRRFSFNDFNQSMQFVNRVAEIAENEGHHPDFHIHWNKVVLDLWTHAMNGLSKNDFIMASKINDLFKSK